MIELTATNIETAVVGLFIQAAQTKYQVPVDRNGEVSFSAELIRGFLEKFQVVLRVEGQVPDGQDEPQPEGIHRAVLRVEPREKRRPEIVEGPTRIPDDGSSMDPACPRCGDEKSWLEV